MENKNLNSIATLLANNGKNYACTLQEYQNQNPCYIDAWDKKDVYASNENELALYKANMNYIISFIESNQHINVGNKLKVGIKTNNCNLKNCIVLYYNERMSLIYSYEYESLAIIEGACVEKEKNKLYMGFNKLISLYPMNKFDAREVVNTYFNGLDEAIQNWNNYLETGMTHDMV